MLALNWGYYSPVSFKVDAPLSNLARAGYLRLRAFPYIECPSKNYWTWTILGAWNCRCNTIWKTFSEIHHNQVDGSFLKGYLQSPELGTKIPGCFHKNIKWSKLYCDIICNNLSIGLFYCSYIYFYNVYNQSVKQTKFPSILLSISTFTLLLHWWLWQSSTLSLLLSINGYDHRRCPLLPPYYLIGVY